jgi:excisionase family DNA binding protein
MSTSVAPSSTDPSARLLDVQEVAELLRCSTRHVYRLSDAGRMPAPVKLGALVRWNLGAIDTWIAQGCPAVRSTKRPGR